MAEQLRLEQIETPEFLDTFYSVLSNAIRRNALQYLLTNPNPVSVDRLALELAAIEHEVPAEAVTSEHQHDIQMLLTHVHLPSLSDAGVVDWDRECEQVTLTPLLNQLSVTGSAMNGLPELSVSPRSEPSH
ncbi:DUF7344 domain-containing protein [Natronorubrum texcoconense]|uniref:DUF7344 domain-containing protein n=1 Tax=Natronorubrum texcoconense TaxID=1095776 RepID=A0A1G9AGG4_9EURY|nr:hypothetical protein [Natronorubrum texcoconense]SDK25894.1 hypothetical protein SAMN04515672_2711 [Natronorubrum texcoconense]